jgi:Protein of unknown function (DUF2924)
MRNGRASPQSAPDDGQIAQEIERISGLDLMRVRALWSATFKKAPPGALTRDLLVRQLAWRIQEKAFGGHDAATLRLLDAYRRQDADKVVLFRRLKPGTSVIREYQGVRHIVTITEGGFVWQGRIYDSLSAIAREITGSRWNGPRFFGLRAADKAGSARKAS